MACWHNSIRTIQWPFTIQIREHRYTSIYEDTICFPNDIEQSLVFRPFSGLMGVELVVLDACNTLALPCYRKSAPSIVLLDREDFSFRLSFLSNQL